MPGPIDAQHLEAQLASARELYARLVFVTGPRGSGKTRLLCETATRCRFPVLNVGERLADRLMGLPARQRAARAAPELDLLVQQAGSETVALDHIEVLFAAELQIDVGRVLRATSRNTTLLVAWPGEVSDMELSYATSDHPEYHRIPIEGVLVSSLSH